MYSLLQLHPAENQGTLWLFLISRKEALLTGKTFELPGRICFHCVASQTPVKQRELVRDCALLLLLLLLHKAVANENVLRNNCF